MGMKNKPGHMKNPAICPVCKGEGGEPKVIHGVTWNNMCYHCKGWGYVEGASTDVTCVPHKWERIKILGNCFHLFKCSKCGKEEEVDSSG